jgi:hypothetical protein
MSEQNIETALRHLKAALALLEKSQSKKKKNGSRQSRRSLGQ